MKIFSFLGLSLALLGPLISLADLSPLNDTELSGVDGEGVNFALEDFSLEGSASDMTIEDFSGIEKVTVENLYIMGAGSNGGSSKQTITLGRLENPFNLDVVDVEGESNKALSFKFPDFFANRGADLGMRNTITLLDTGRTDVWELEATDFSLDGSEVRLWGNGSQTFADLQISLHADTMLVKMHSCVNHNSCNFDAVAGGVVSLSNLDVDLRLGYGDIFPVEFDIKSDGNFTLSATGLNESNYETYYANSAKSSIDVGNIDLRGTNVGRQEISGIRIQYLELVTHDI